MPLLLANEYRDMKFGVAEESRECYQKRVKELKLKDGPSISESRSGEQGDAYYLDHPLNPGKRILLDQHLKRGTDRDPRNPASDLLYMGSRRAVGDPVGWLPGHLDTRQS